MCLITKEIFTQSKKYYIRRDKSKVNSVKTGGIITASRFSY